MRAWISFQSCRHQGPPQSPSISRATPPKAPSRPPPASGGAGHPQLVDVTLWSVTFSACVPVPPFPFCHKDVSPWMASPPSGPPLNCMHLQRAYFQEVHIHRYLALRTWKQTWRDKGKFYPQHGETSR